MVHLARFALVASLLVISVSAASIQSPDDEKDVPVPENLEMMSTLIESLMGNNELIPESDEDVANLKMRCTLGTRVCNLHCLAKGKRYGRCVHGKCVCY